MACYPTVVEHSGLECEPSIAAQIRILPSDRHAPSLIPPQGAQTETETKRQKTKIGTHLWKVRHGRSAQEGVLRVLWVRERRVENKSHCGRLRMLCWGFGAVADHGQTYTAHRRLLAAKHYCTHQDARSAYPYLPGPNLYKVFSLQSSPQPVEVHSQDLLLAKGLPKRKPASEDRGREQDPREKRPVPEQNQA